jgi:D-lactate dehydrogenase (cytochrome)
MVDPDQLRSVVEDAAHVSGYATALVTPSSEAAVAEVLRTATSVLPIGAQSSLTGGATPRGEVVLSTARLNRIVDIRAGSVRVEAGVPLTDLDAALARAGAYYPPAPTFMGAFVGGTVATNAAGAATFKYGTTRDWVESLTVILPTGHVLDIDRGQVRADADGGFDLALGDRAVRLRIPRYRMPDVPKVSAGYFAAPGMDLIDLFIGAEGTLGVITAITLRTVTPRPAWALAFVPCPDRATGLALVGRLRAAAKETWRTRDPAGLDVSAIEYLDARCLRLAREDGIDRKNGIGWPEGTSLALLVTLELPAGLTSAQAFDQIGAFEVTNVDAPLARFCRAMSDAGVFDEVVIAVPGDRARMAQLVSLREEVPAAVNARVGRAKLTVDARIEKTAGDMIVPFDRLCDILDFYDREFGRRGLDAAVWGHVSDGNLHPNVLPRSYDDMVSGREALLEIGRQVISMNGSPLAEHGVGRSGVKQQLLEMLYGADGLDQMRAVKHALDPTWKLAPGVLFPRV